MDLVKQRGQQFLLIAISLLLLAATGCREKTDVAEEKRKRYQVDKKISAAGIDPTPDNSASLNTESGIANATDVEALMSQSQMLDMRSQQISFKEMMDDLVTQQKIAERLLQLELNEEQRLFAVQSLLLSLMKRVATSDLKARETIIETLPNYLEDKNKTIQQIAWSAKATIHLTDFLRIEDADSAELDGSIDQLLSRFQDNPVVARELQGIVVQLMIRERRDKAVQMMEKLSQAYANSSNPNLQNMAEVIRDRMYLTQIEFDIVAEKMRAGDEAYKEQFLEMVEQLAQRKGMGKEIYREILWTERWLEEIDQYQDAERMLGTLEKNLADHPDETFRQIVAEDISKARSRLQLVGQPLVLKGQNRAGTSLSTEDQHGKVTLVVFWSATEPNSVQLVQQLIQIYRRYQGRDLEIVSYCIDKNIAQALSVLGNQSPPWVSMYRKEGVPDEQGPDQAGVQQLPFLILLDRDGKVIDVNVSIRKLPAELEKALQE